MHNVFALCRLFHRMTIEDFALIVGLPIETIPTVGNNVEERTPHIIEQYINLIHVDITTEAFNLMCEQKTFVDKLIFGNILRVLNFIIGD